MPIKISQIEADSLGPLSTFKEDFADITLIYGHNETGKTFLVELILQSLFKNLTGFKDEFRIKKPKGKVTLFGLEDKLVTFSPTSKDKLDTTLEANGQEMPPNIARLLVVKGGETEIEKNSNSGGISHASIREFLSSQGIFNAIQKNIPLKATKEAKIELGEIIGSPTGDIRRRSEVTEELSNINRLLERVNLELADGDVLALQKQMAEVTNDIKSLEAAKKHAAYQIDQEKREAENGIRKFNDADFPGLESNYAEYFRKKGFLQKKLDELETARQRGEHYPWLNTAIEEYQKYLIEPPVTLSNTYLIATLVLLITAILLVVFGQNWPAIIAILLAAGTGFWHVDKSKRSHTGQMEQMEIEQIQATYRVKFDEPCKELPTMRAKLDMIVSDYHAIQQLGKEVGEVEDDIKDLESKIQQGLKQLGQSDLSSELWGETINELRNEFSALQSQVQKLETELARYDVDPSDYVTESPGRNYHREEYEKVQEEREKIEQSLKHLEQSLQNLKSEIQGVVQSHSLTDWGELIHALRELKLEKVKQFKNLTTDIIAGNLLNQVVEQSREQEDEKILENLGSEIVTKPLHQITQEYVGFEIEQDTLQVIDKYSKRFDLKDLSTGTREQILLALRMGFASKLMQDDSAFLILDDAFQHSDWSRRPHLVDTVFELAKQGWQIIYFSMDDHIRDLFHQKSQNACEVQFKAIEL